MKKLLMAVAAFGMLLTSCAKDDVVAPVEDKEALVSFCVNSPAVATRYGEGETAQDLYYAVYDTQEGYVAGLSKVDGSVEIKTSTTVNLNLVQGRSYEVIFWAQAEAEDAPYTLAWGNTAAEATMTYDPQATLTANNEAYDAFYAHVESFEVKGAVSQTVELKRPFAQLNVATADTALASTAGVDIATTGVEVKGVYTSLNLANDTVDGETTLTFAPTTKANGKISANGKEYDHIAMNYLLVNAKKLVDVTLTLAENNNTAALTRNYTSVPVQRNYRTNIIGNILTSAAQFNVVILPGFTEPAYEGFYIDEDGENATVTTTSGLHELAEMINNGEVPSDIDITLDGDIDLSSMSMRSTSSNWTPIGTPENPYTGTFNGNGNTINNLQIYNTEDVWYVGLFGNVKNATIKNVKLHNAIVDCPKGLHFAALVGNAEGTTVIENVTVTGDVTVSGDIDNVEVGRIGVIVGGNSGNFSLKNITINVNEGSIVEGNSSIGGVAGQLQGSASFENVKSNIDVRAARYFAGGIIGLAPASTTFANCSTSGDITLTAGTGANSPYRLGGIAGGWADNVKTPCVLENCSYTGTLVSGDVTSFDCDGFVGRGYNTVVGATVSVNGTDYVYADNGVYHYVGAILEVGGVKAIIYTVEDGVKAVSVEEITLTGKNWQYAMDWAAGLGEGWALASMEELNAIYDVRCELNDALEADSAENALFWEGDELYIKNGSIYYACYMSSTEAPAGETDPKGEEYWSNQVFMKFFNDLGYNDYLYSAMDCINKYAPLRENHFARGVVTIK